MIIRLGLSQTMFSVHFLSVNLEGTVSISHKKGCRSHGI